MEPNLYNLEQLDLPHTTSSPFMLTNSEYFQEKQKVLGLAESVKLSPLLPQN